MSTVNSGPQIVRNGLVLDLDASYMRSYSPNVMPNPTDIFAWCGGAGVNACTISRDATMSRQYGSIPLKMVISGTDPYIASYASSAWNLAPAANGQTWTVSVYAKASTVTTGELFFFGADSSGNYGGAGTYGGSVTVNIGTSWTRVSASFTISGVNVAYAQIRLDGTQAGGAGITIWWDGLQVERASSATQFNPYYFGNTSWRDVSGNARNGTLTSGPLFNSSNGGNIIFNGSTQYVIFPSGGSYSEYTFMFFCKWITDTANGSRIFGSDGFGTYTVFTPSNVGFHYNQAAGSSTTISSGVNVGLGTWCHVAVTVSALSTFAYIYINGTLRNGSNAPPYVNLSGNLFLGAQNSGLFANCNIASFQLYNRVLAASEISQIYQATKSRFGL